MKNYCGVVCLLCAYADTVEIWMYLCPNFMNTIKYTDQQEIDRILNIFSTKVVHICNS